MTGGEKTGITSFIKEAGRHLIIDVRSPKEFAHAHIPGAVNIPVFDDEERKVVGTIYKQESRELAIKKALDFWGPKMRSIIEQAETLLEQHQHKNTERTTAGPTTFYLYCWRGGMRSQAMGWLLQLYGFKVKVLTGGYKSFRRWALHALAFPYQLNVLGGFTGSGKTELLQEIAQRGELVVDLEKLASHKGSAFGKNGVQPGQEQFENNLALTLHATWEKSRAGENNTGALKAILGQKKPIWVEDESQRIGQLNIPPAFWSTMREAPVYFLDIPFEKRLDHITQQYALLDTAYLEGGIQRISKRLGGVAAKEALAYLEAKDLTGCFHILLTYYDKSYLKGLHNRKHLSSLLTKVTCDKVTSENANLLLSNHSFV